MGLNETMSRPNKNFRPVGLTRVLGFDLGLFLEYENTRVGLVGPVYLKSLLGFLGPLVIY